MKSRIYAVLMFFILGMVSASAQQYDSRKKNGISLMLDSLRQDIPDTTRVTVMAELVGFYGFNNPDTAIYFANEAMRVAREIGFIKGEIKPLRSLAITLRVQENFSEALKMTLYALKLARQNHLQKEQGEAFWELGQIYREMGDFEKSREMYAQAIKILESDPETKSDIYTTLSLLFIREGNYDSAILINKKYEHEIARRGNSDAIYENLHFTSWAFYGSGQLDSALIYSNRSRPHIFTEFYQIVFDLTRSQILLEMGQGDSSLYYAKRSIEPAVTHGYIGFARDLSLQVSRIYEQTENLDSALYYKDLAINLVNELDSRRNSSIVKSYSEFEQSQRNYELETAEREYQANIRYGLFVACLVILLIIVLFVYRNSRVKQRGKEAIEKAYHQLKATQSQLIHAEKMASLGELTAGIAHEIQNPLNFVNNFSDVNKELAVELLEEIEKGNEQEAKAIIKDIIENEEKILHHGKRADGIVKGMLQHSRTSTGEKEPTDINALCDEYLRLAYHGLRAKDKSFNADYKLELDPALPRVNVVPQDIGRVLLNLINNAFYAVSERAKNETEVYKPTVVLRTTHKSPPASPAGRLEGGKGGVEISVSDNGPGIPDSIKEKIFQPFFTTKPTGQGTGLGLSLSYDIITKGHGGTITVQSVQDKGSEFLIILPA